MPRVHNTSFASRLSEGLPTIGNIHGIATDSGAFGVPDDVIRAEASRTKRRRIAKAIRKFAELGSDWGERGNVPPTSQAVKEAIWFLDLIPLNCIAPHVALSGDGEINFFWKAPGVYVDVGLRGDGHLEYFAESRPDGVGEDGREAFDGSGIPHGLLSAIPAA